MIADLQEVVKQGGFTVFDKRFIDEMRVFVWDKAGKAQGEAGEHDDCVITLAGLIQLHQRCPLNEDYSYDTPEPEGPKEFAVAGQVDTPIVEEGDELECLYDTEQFKEAV